MNVEIVGTAGSAVTLLFTDIGANRLHFRHPGEATYRLNFDTDGDGTNDAIVATFSYSDPSPVGVQYFIVQQIARNTVGVAAVLDVTDLDHGGTYAWADRNVPHAFLGSEYRDKVSGGSFDWIAGNGGDDILRADDACTMVGGAGNDRLFGAAYADRLDGGAGRDILTGGGGADTFVFTADTLDARDIVTDFSQVEGDRVDLTGFAAGLAFVDAFTGTGPEVQARQLGDRTALVFDLDGDGGVDARVTFIGTIAFTAEDLILPATL